MSESKIAGCLFGTALGDALGAETEFLNMDGIRQKFPPNGPDAPLAPYNRITDDTQMALAVGQALLAPPYTPQNLETALIQAFIRWIDDEAESFRAPGVTCVTSVENLKTGQTWQDATNISSKGCGANMRVQAVGLLPIDATERAAIAQFQAALTHGHPTALAASDLTAFVIADQFAGGDVDYLAARVRDYAESQRTVYHADWLSTLWERPRVMATPQEYIAHGWGECIAVLDRLDEALRVADYFGDPCEITGAGWIAEEAFATALLCFLMYPDAPKGVIRRAAFSSGDSDSIACIAGAFAGARHGIDAWPIEWTDGIEYHDRLARLAADLAALPKSSQ